MSPHALPSDPLPVEATPPTVEPARDPGDQPGHPPVVAVAPRPARGGRLLRRAGRATAIALLVWTVFAGGVAADRSGFLGGPAAASAKLTAAAPATGRPASTAAPQDPTQFAIVRQAWDLLRTQYVDAKGVDPTKMAYGAIEGMTQAIGDKGHTGFLAPADRKVSQAALAGTFIGIGVELDTSVSPPVVVGVIHGGPSEAAGILPGDAIVAVDGKATRGQSPDSVSTAVRGTAGTKVTLAIARPGTSAPLSFTITRAEIKVPPVDSAMIPGTTLGMIRVEQFSSGAGDAFAGQLKALLAHHPSGLVLDLRGDPGGYVSEAVAVASQFLTGGDVYSTRDASGTETPVAVKPGALAPTIPLVVLVDSGTASSAEIVAGALQDAGRARLVGTTTFGTGTVVAEYPLTDGSALRIGTIEWLTPKRQPIWRHGITPTDTVTLAQGVRPVTPNDLATLGASGVASTTDTQLDTAIARLASGSVAAPPAAPGSSASPAPG